MDLPGLQGGEEEEDAELQQEEEDYKDLDSRYFQGAAAKPSTGNILDELVDLEDADDIDERYFGVTRQPGSGTKPPDETEENVNNLLQRLTINAPGGGAERRIDMPAPRQQQETRADEEDQPLHNYQLDSSRPRRAPLGELFAFEEEAEEGEEGGGGGEEEEEAEEGGEETGTEASTETEEETTVNAVVEEEFNRDVARLSATIDVSPPSTQEANGIGLECITRIAARLKELGVKEQAETIVYRWWQQNRRKIIRDTAIAVAGSVLLGAVLPLLGGPAIGFNAFTFIKEMGTMSSLWTLGGTLATSLVGSLRSAVFTTAREAAKGKNLLGSTAVKRVLDILHVPQSMRVLDAETLLAMAEIPVSVALQPDMFKRLVLERAGMWAPLTPHTQRLRKLLFYKTLSAAGIKAGTYAGKSALKSVGPAIGSAIVSAALLPRRIVTAIINDPRLKETSSAVARKIAEGVSRGAEYVSTSAFRKELRTAIKTDSEQNQRATETVRAVLNDAIKEADQALEAEVERIYTENPVPVEILAEAANVPVVRMVDLPPPIAIAQVESTFSRTRISTVVGMGASVAGWVATAAALRMVGAPSIQELSSVLPDEYKSFILTNSAGTFLKDIKDHVDIETTAYTIVSNSIGLPGLIKQLAGNVPLPKIEALNRLNQRISDMGASAASDNSSGIAREFMSIMLGDEIYTRKKLEEMSVDNLIELWKKRGGAFTDGSRKPSKNSLVAAILKQQKDSAAGLHRVVLDGLASQALGAAGTAALGGAAKIVYSHASGVYAAIAENSDIARAAGIDELSSRTLAGILKDPTSYDPYGIFQASAKYSKDIAANIAQTGENVVSLAYEAKRKLDDYMASVAIPQPTQQAGGLSLPPQQPLPEGGFEAREMFERRVAHIEANRVGLAFSPQLEEWVLTMSKKTAEALKENQLREEIQYYESNTSRTTSSDPFQTPVVDQRALTAAMELAVSVSQRTKESLSATLGNLAEKAATEALARAILGTLLGLEPPKTTAAQPVVAQPTTAAGNLTPLKVDMQKFDAFKGRFIDPLSDVVAKRLVEAALDTGATALLEMLKAKAIGLVAASSTTTFLGQVGILAGAGMVSGVGAAMAAAGAYNQAAKYTNKALDITQIVRAVALSISSTKDSVLAKLPNVREWRLPEVGSLKELLEKSGLWEKIAEERKIDVHAVLTEQLTAYATSRLTTGTQMSKMELFTNLAWALVGPLEPGVSAAVRQNTQGVVDLLAKRFAAEDEAVTGSIPEQV